MKPLNPKTLAALAGVVLLAALFVQPRPAARAGSSAPPSEPGDAGAWADPDAAERSRDLDDRTRQVLGRLTRKLALVADLVRGERPLADVVAWFRELNGPGVDQYREMARQYPAAGEEELAYRQVIEFARMAVHAERGGPLPRLEHLEADLARRFPPAATNPAP